MFKQAVALSGIGSSSTKEQDLVPYDDNLVQELKIKQKLLEGEKIYSVISATFECIPCKISLSNYRIVIFPLEDEHPFSTAKMNIPIGCIDLIDSSPNVLHISCKDFRDIKFTQCREADSFMKKVMAFRKMPYVLSKPPKQSAGKPKFEMQREFERQKIPCSWRVCFANEGYSVCSSYPQHVIIPSSISDEGKQKKNFYEYLKKTNLTQKRGKNIGRL